MSKQSDLVNVSQGADGDPLYVDTTNNAVGIGTSSIDYTAANRTVVHIEGSSGALLAMEDTGAKSYLFQAGDDLLIENDTASGSMIFGTNSSTERMRIDSAGRVTMPYQPAFVAYNAPATLTNNAVIVWDSTALNRGSVYNTSNGRFTAPVAGLYQFFASVRIENSVGTATYHRVSFRHNGSDIYWSKSRLNPRTVTGYYTHAASDQIIDMSAGDYVDVKFEASFSSCSTSSRTEHVFYGYLIG